MSFAIVGNNRIRIALRHRLSRRVREHYQLYQDWVSLAISVRSRGEDQLQLRATMRQTCRKIDRYDLVTLADTDGEPISTKLDRHAVAEQELALLSNAHAG